MSTINQYEVSVNNIDEKLNLIMLKSEDNIAFTINYKNVIFSNKINIKEDSIASTDNNNDKGMGIHNIYNFILYSLENNNTDFEFIENDECEIVSFEVVFNIKMNDFVFGYHITLDGDYDEFNDLE
jgi:hypothetical protein